MNQKEDSVEKVREELKATKTELKNDIKELRGDMASLRSELKQDIKDAVDDIAQRLVRHLYAKDEIDRKFQIITD